MLHGAGSFLQAFYALLLYLHDAGVLLVGRLQRKDELRAHKGSKLAELYLHGKLLYAAVLEKMTQSRFANAKRKLDNPRRLTDWRLWKTVADDLNAGIKACFPVDARFEDDNIKSLSERPRKRTLQCLPSPLLALLSQCREMGMSRV